MDAAGFGLAAKNEESRSYMLNIFDNRIKHIEHQSFKGIEENLGIEIPDNVQDEVWSYLRIKEVCSDCGKRQNACHKRKRCICDN